MQYILFLIGLLLLLLKDKNANNIIYLYLYGNLDSCLRKLKKEKKVKYLEDIRGVLKDFQKILALKIDNKL